MFVSFNSATGPGDVLIDPRSVSAIGPSFIPLKFQLDDRHYPMPVTAIIAAGSTWYVIESVEKVRQMLDDAEEQMMGALIGGGDDD